MVHNTFTLLGEHVGLACFHVGVVVWDNSVGVKLSDPTRLALQGERISVQSAGNTLTTGGTEVAKRVVCPEAVLKSAMTAVY